jgi:hypothetical protein
LDVSESAASAEFSPCTPSAPQPNDLSIQTSGLLSIVIGRAGALQGICAFCASVKDNRPTIKGLVKDRPSAGQGPLRRFCRIITSGQLAFRDQICSKLRRLDLRDNLALYHRQSIQCAARSPDRPTLRGAREYSSPGGPKHLELRPLPPGLEGPMDESRTTNHVKVWRQPTSKPLQLRFR